MSKNGDLVTFFAVTNLISEGSGAQGATTGLWESGESIVLR